MRAGRRRRTSGVAADRVVRSSSARDPTARSSPLSEIDPSRCTPERCRQTHVCPRENGQAATRVHGPRRRREADLFHVGHGPLALSGWPGAVSRSGSLDGTPRGRCGNLPPQGRPASVRRGWRLPGATTAGESRGHGSRILREAVSRAAEHGARERGRIAPEEHRPDPPLAAPGAGFPPRVYRADTTSGPPRGSCRVRGLRRGRFSPST